MFMDTLFSGGLLTLVRACAGFIFQVFIVATLTLAVLQTQANNAKAIFCLGYSVPSTQSGFLAHGNYAETSFGTYSYAVDKTS